MRLSNAMQNRRLFGELDHPCLTSDDFRVLTLAGWKPFREIAEGDKVWSRKDGKAVVSTVTGIVDQSYAGPVLRVRGRGIDSEFTPAHRFLVLRRPDGTKYEDRSEVYVTLAEIDENRSKYRHSAIPKTAEWVTEDYSDFVLPPYRAERGRFKNDVSLPLTVPSRVMAAFVGIYLAEGSCREQEGSFQVFIAQKSAWGRQYIRNEVLSRIHGVEWNETDTGFQASDPRLFAFLNPLGDCYTKYVPDSIKKLDAECLRELVYWFTIGDGRIVDVSSSSERDRSRTFKEQAAESVRKSEAPFVRKDVFSVSERLIRDLHECVVRYGGSGSLTQVESPEDYEFAGRVIETRNKVPLHQLHLSSTEHVWLDPRSLTIERRDYEGRIYCLSVTNGNFLMEQGGRTFWTGNSDGRTQLTRASHLVTTLRVEEDGKVIGEAEVLDTSRGRDLRALLESGCQVGVSSRGYGSVKSNGKGQDVVQEDYQLVTFDFVAEPADSTAYPQPFSEDKERQMGISTDDEKAADQKLAKKFAAQVQKEAEEAEKEKEKDDLQAKFESDILSNLGQLSAEAREMIRSELLADPQVARAKSALEQIKTVLRPFVLPEDAAAELKQRDERIARLEAQVKEKDLQIRTTASQVESLSRLAKEAGYKYFLERSLAGFQDRKLVIEMIGDVNQFANAEALKQRVNEAVSELVTRQQNEEHVRQQQVAREREIREAAKRESERLREEAAVYERNVKELKEALEKSLEANRLLGVQLYAEQRVATHPRARTLRQLIERSGATSKKDIDQILEDAREPVRSSDESERIRSRVRAVTAGGRGPTAADEEKPRPAPRSVVEEDYNGLGIDLATLKTLSNLPSNQ